MKNKLTKLALTLPLVLAATTSQATYTIRIAMETTDGGSLPAGSIVFSNKNDAPVGPVTPTEPEVVDPFEPENAACDPWGEGYPANSTGKDLIWGVWYDYSFTDGKTYRPCKLKPVQKDKLLARFSFAFPESMDKCNPVNGISGNNGANSCGIKSQIFQFNYNYSIAGDGSYSYTNLPVTFYVPSNAGFVLADIDRIVFDGASCVNPRNPAPKPPFNVVVDSPRCDLSIPYSEMKSKANTPFIVEIYGK